MKVKFQLILQEEIMSDNIVVFGPTHSGKSTFLGYLITYGMSEDEYNRNNRKIRGKIEQLGGVYKSDRALAYYVDKGIDEIVIYNKQQKSKGTSKRIHIEKTALDIRLKCTFIDTPGSDVAWRHKYEGLFLGDIGLFMIEIGKLTELSRKVIGSNAYTMMYNQLFSPLYLWKHYKRMKRLIIIISKIDMAFYSPYTIKRAESILRSIDILKEVPIIPICIDVEQRRGYNIIESKKLDWYIGNSLIREIKNMLAKEYEESTYDPTLFAHVEKIIPRTKSNNQPAVRIKVLNGTIHEKDEIYLGPVKYNGKNILLKGQILSLKNETLGVVNNLAKGDIGGIIFSKLWYGRERLKLVDVKLKRTSMIYQDFEGCRKGNLLYFNIEKRYLTDDLLIYFSNIVIGSRLKLIWFGKIISMHLLSLMENSVQYNIVLMNTSSESLFMLPIKENGRFLYEQFVLQLSELLFVNAYLSDLEMISEQSKRAVVFTVDGEIDNINTLKSVELDFDFSYDLEANETIIQWNNLTDRDINRAMQSTRKLLKNRGIINYKITFQPQENI